MIGIVFAFLRGMSPLAWGVVFVVAALGWGAYQRNEAKIAQQTLAKAELSAAKEQEATLQKLLEEMEQRIKAQEEVVKDAQVKLETAARAASATRAVSSRVRAASNAYAASAAASSAAVGGDCKATEATLYLFADLLGRATDRATELADLADRQRIAGQACEEAYNVLRK